MPETIAKASSASGVPFADSSCLGFGRLRPISRVLRSRAPPSAFSTV
jgi:hypothetical protein